MTMYHYPTVMTIAGFDGSGGAGIQADIKTISALGCYATSVLTALPVQNTTGVRSIHPIPGEVVAQQLENVLEDITPDAIKIGMVHTEELVDVIASFLRGCRGIPIVLDPVMVATSGHRLIKETTIQAIVEGLFPLTTLITPNMDELAIFSKMEVKTLDDMKSAGRIARKLGGSNWLLKGGHQRSEILTSLLLDENEELYGFEYTKVATNNTHGSGCTLSSAIAAYLAQGETLYEAVALAQRYVVEAIKAGANVKVGNGNGPLNHFFDPQPLIKNRRRG